jgi:uncharacterized protein YbbK (DUF523 family)
MPLSHMDKVIVSACLAGCPCRYNGQSYPTDLPSHVMIVSFCPEVSGGLPTPREPAEIVGGDGDDVLAGRAKVLTRNGADVTTQYLQGAFAMLNLAEEQKIRRAILKSRSPSCGASAIYDGTYSGALRNGAGVAAALLRSKGISLEER